ncbi:hypothetical protein [Antribacter soli]|nr:hypothetical protein [Antribacter soli]
MNDVALGARRVPPSCSKSRPLLVGDGGRAACRFARPPARGAV